MDLLARAITTFLLRFFGHRATLADSLAGAGLAILANTLVLQGAIRAAELGAEGPRGCRPPPHPPRSTQDPDCHSSTRPHPFPCDAEVQRGEARCPRSHSGEGRSQAWTGLEAGGRVCGVGTGLGGRAGPQVRKRSIQRCFLVFEKPGVLHRALGRWGGCPARSFPTDALRPQKPSLGLDLLFEVGDGEGQGQVSPSGCQAGVEGG